MGRKENYESQLFLFNGHISEYTLWSIHICSKPLSPQLCLEVNEIILDCFLAILLSVTVNYNYYNQRLDVSQKRL